MLKTSNHCSQACWSLRKKKKVLFLIISQGEMIDICVPKKKKKKSIMGRLNNIDSCCLQISLSFPHLPIFLLFFSVTQFRQEMNENNLLVLCSCCSCWYHRKPPTVPFPELTVAYSNKLKRRNLLIFLSLIKKIIRKFEIIKILWIIVTIKNKTNLLTF